MRIMLMLISCLFITTEISTQTIYILIHGTWGSEGRWHKPNSEFFNVLQEKVSIHDGRLVSFNWSGKNKHKARVQAAEELEALITSYDPTTKIVIIAHSHGTNVVSLASHFLSDRSQNYHKIHAVYSFGTPVDQNLYLPNMEIINYFYHFFSFNDFVQPVLGMFYREYPCLDRVANIRILINGHQPSHNGLHSPLVAEWLPDIHEGLSAECLGNFRDFDFSQPGLIQFESGSVPRYSIDYRKGSLIDTDNTNTMLLTSKINNTVKTETLEQNTDPSDEIMPNATTNGQTT